MTHHLLNALKQAFWLSAVAALTGCHINLLPSNPAPSLYDVRTAPAYTASMPTVAWQLIVDEPRASHELDNDRIATRPTASEVKYFAAVRWTERAPRLVQSRVVEAFEKSGRIVGIARGALGIHSDYELISELRSFEVVDGADSARPAVHVALNFQVVRQSSSTILASKTFEGLVPANGDSIGPVTAAFGTALDQVLAAAIPWTLSIGEADYQKQPKSSPGSSGRP